VPRLFGEQRAEIGDGVLSLDVLARQYIREPFEYPYVTLPNGKDALALEREVQRGALALGKPFLNPL
jgi:hypothetical protein